MQRGRLLEIPFIIFLGNLNCIFSSNVTRDGHKSCDITSRVTQLLLFAYTNFWGKYSINHMSIFCVMNEEK